MPLDLQAIDVSENHDVRCKNQVIENYMLLLKIWSLAWIAYMHSFLLLLLYIIT